MDPSSPGSPAGVRRCPFCAEEILSDAVKCRHCGEWLNRAQQPGFQPPPGAQPGLQAAAAPAAIQPFEMQNVYEPSFDLRRFTPEQLAAFQQHGIRTTFPTGVAILLHYLTLGIFTQIHFQLKHSNLPRVRPDDWKAGRAIGFLFIPFFNFYWIFATWLRLTDRINFQFRLRGQPPPIAKGLVTTAVAIGIIPYIGLISWLALYPVVIAQFRGACNQLAQMR